MKQSRISRILFVLLGYGSLTLSLLLGCSFSGKSDSVRIESGRQDPHHPPQSRNANPV